MLGPKSEVIDTQKEVINMKKRIIAGLLLILAIVLVGCARKTEAVQTPGESDQADQTAPTILVTWAGFTTDNSIWKGSLNTDRKLINDQSLPIYRFDAKSELDRFMSEHSGVFSFDSGFEEVPSFEEAAVKYSDSFFAEHSILVVYVPSGNDTLRYSVKDIQYEDAKLLVNMQTDYSAKQSGGYAGWFIVVEIDRSDYQGCNSYDALLPYLL